MFVGRPRLFSFKSDKETPPPPPWLICHTRIPYISIHMRLVWCFLFSFGGSRSEHLVSLVPASASGLHPNALDCSSQIRTEVMDVRETTVEVGLVKMLGFEETWYEDMMLSPATANMVD